MTGEVKLGLLLGVGVVVAAALIYYRPDGTTAKPTEASVKAQVGRAERSIQLSPAPNSRE